jgi:hypothetical protein
MRHVDDEIIFFKYANLHMQKGETNQPPSIHPEQVTPIITQLVTSYKTSNRDMLAHL